MECIEIKVRKETADRWRKASPETKEKIERRIEIELARGRSRDSKERFIKYLDDLGRKMEERGMTEEKLKDILANE